MSKLTKQITEAIKKASKPTTSAYDTTAVVRRIEGKTAWVHIPGGVDETPVKLTINARAGDNVQVRVSGGSAWIVGNASEPPTSDRKADSAVRLAKKAMKQATKYVTTITGRDGVCVHDAEDESNYANINSDGMIVYKNGDKVASFGSNSELIARGPNIRGTRKLVMQGIGVFLNDGTNDLAGIGFVNKANGYPDGGYMDFGKGARIYVQSQSGHISPEGTTDEGAIDLMTSGGRGAVVHTDKSIGFGNAAGTFVAETHTVLSSETFAQYNVKSSTKTFTKSGYYPIGIVGHDNGSGDINAATLQLTSRSSGSATLTYTYKHIGANTSRTVTTTVTILWVKYL